VPSWNIIGGPDEMPREGIDAKRWRWLLASADTGLVILVIVKVSGSAMAVAPENLPRATRDARESCGRSEIDKILEWWEPPSVIELHTHSSEATLGGGAKKQPDNEGPQTERRLRELEAWFDSHGLALDFVQQKGGSWFALVSMKDQRVGSGVVGAGSTRVEAAEDAARRSKPLDDSQDVTVVAATAEAHATATPGTVVISPSGIPSGEAVGTPGIDGFDEAAREKLETVATDFGWLIRFAKEPDGGFFWLVLDGTTGETIKGGSADTWDDARLAVIEDIYPPSDEDNTRN
jgi:hypothetical protein